MAWIPPLVLHWGLEKLWDLITKKQPGPQVPAPPPNDIQPPIPVAPIPPPMSNPPIENAGKKL